MVVPNGITSVPNFIQIRTAVFEFNIRTDKHDQPFVRLFQAHHTKNAHVVKQIICRTLQ